MYRYVHLCVHVWDRDRWLRCYRSEEPKGGQGKAQTTYIFKAEREIQRAMSLYFYYLVFVYFLKELNLNYVLLFSDVSLVKMMWGHKVSDLIFLFFFYLVKSNVGSTVKASAMYCVNIFLPNVTLRKIFRWRHSSSMMGKWFGGPTSVTGWPRVE